MLHKQEIVDEARTYIGVPWVHQGRSKKNGVDCAGMIECIARTLGLADSHITNYTRRAHGYDFLMPFREKMKEKHIKDADVSNVLLFRDSKYPCHSAIVGKDHWGNLTIIHAYARRRKVIEELLNQEEWLSKRTACFSFYGVED